MKEKEFKKLNERLRQQQAQIAKAREKQSPNRISATTCSILKNRPIEENNPDGKVKATEKCERCGKADCELIAPPKGRHKLLCPECETKRQKYFIEQIRTERKQKQKYIHHWIEQIIPKAYQKARLRHLGQKFKRELLSYDKTTGLVLYGPTGTGKTYALFALLRSLIASGLKCDWIGYEELCLMIRDTFKNKSRTSELDILDRYRKVDVLLIEDLGSSKPIGTAESDFSLRVIYVLLNSRLERERLTLISTNKTLENLKTSFDERISSRLSTMKWLGVGGHDKRAKV